MRAFVPAVALGLCGLAATACGGGPGRVAAYSPSIDPAEFSTTIDNPYLPLVPGTRMVYESPGERIVVEVTRDTRTVMGVDTIVVRDVASAGGQVIEDTYDWYAQHRDGTVWYFGEDTKELENGQVTSTLGSWEAGVAGARPGIVMPGAPRVGHVYRQEYRPGVAEDMGEVLSVTERAAGPTGRFADVVKTRDTTPLDPELVEEKYYAAGVGLVLAVDIAGGSDRAELVAVERF